MRKAMKASDAAEAMLGDRRRSSMSVSALLLGANVTGAGSPRLIAELTADKVVNRYAAAARAVAEDIGPEDFEDDVFVNALHRYSEAALDSIAQEGVNMSYRAGRADGLSDAEDEARAQGRRLIWRRSSAMESATCKPCADADGSEIDGPDDDLTEIHEGPPETCLCIPYADLTEESE